VKAGVLAVDVPRSRLVKYPLLLKTIQKHVCDFSPSGSRRASVDA